MGVFIEGTEDSEAVIAPITVYTTASSNDSYSSFEQRFNSKVIINTPQNGGNRYDYGITNHYTISWLFEQCRNFNQPVELPNNCPYMRDVFFNCHNFNQPVKLSNWYWQNFQGMFTNCYNFNQPITFPEDCDFIDISGIFSNCRNFNQPITIPNICAGYYNAETNVTKSCSFSSVFSGCSNFNSPVTFGDGVWECISTFAYMFASCKNFNHPVDLMNHPIHFYGSYTQGATAAGMFAGCISLCQEIHFPNTFSDFRSAMYACDSMNNVYVHNDNINLYNNSLYQFWNFTGNRASRGTNSHRLNIFCNNQQQLLFSNSLSIVGAPVTWDYDSTSGCYYNLYQNIYICPMR